MLSPIAILDNPNAKGIKSAAGKEQPIIIRPITFKKANQKNLAKSRGVNANFSFLGRSGRSSGAGMCFIQPVDNAYGQKKYRALGFHSSK